jgi:cell wall assembly regulator SMI1
MTTIEQTFPPISPADLDEFERAEGVALPPEYRDFLLRNNGGRPADNIVDVPNLDEVAVNHFFGLRPGEMYDLRRERAMYEGRVPPGTIPIGDDPGGNLFLLSLADDSKGAVLFWDHEEEPVDEATDWSDFENVYAIAGSFDEFLASLRPYEG